VEANDATTSQEAPAKDVSYAWYEYREIKVSATRQ